MSQAKKPNPYRRTFFWWVNIISILLLLAGVFSVLMLIRQPYHAIAVVVSVLWIVVFIQYFFWAVYHYNINYGLTDEDWQRILNARETGDPNAPDAPRYNPFRSQTFGLPPGTVRGMIAFTLLFGALSLTIASLGNDAETDPNSFFTDHFEFIKTAFLMMIAFYFGDHSLKHLSKRWPRQNGSQAPGQGTNRNPNEPKDDVADDDEAFQEEDAEYAATSGETRAELAEALTPAKDALKKPRQEEAEG